MQLKREKDNEQQNCHDKKETKKKNTTLHTQKNTDRMHTLNVVGATFNKMCGANSDAPNDAKVSTQHV